MPARLYFTRSMRSRRIRSLYASTELWAWVLARRWYTPDKVDAFACSMSYLQQELYPAGYKGPVKPPASIRGYDINVMGMYGVSTVCGHFQRDDLMVKAAKCINKNVANTCAKAPRTQGQPFRVCDGSAKLSNSNAQMNFCGNVHRFDDVDTWECGSGTPYTTKDVPMFPNPNEWNDEEPKTNETLFAQYFVFSGSGADPCAAELKARKDVATRAVLNGAHCRAHDAFGFQRTPTMVRALEYLPGYAGPNDIFGEYDPVLDFQMTDRPSGDSNGPYGPHRAPVFDRANFWDGSSAADLSASAIFGVELPAFDGFGYQDGQGPQLNRFQACESAFDFGQKNYDRFLAVIGWDLDSGMRSPRDRHQKTKEEWYDAAVIDAAKADTTVGYVGYLEDRIEEWDNIDYIRDGSFYGSELKSSLEGDTNVAMWEANALSSLGYEEGFSNWGTKAIYIRADPRFPRADDVMLADPRRLLWYNNAWKAKTAADDRAGRYRAPISPKEYMSIVEGFRRCVLEATEFKEPDTCTRVQFTRSVWRGVAPAGQQAGWECIEDLGSDYASQPRPSPSPPVPSSPPSVPPPLLPPVLACQGNPGTFDAGYGSCATYAPDQGNNDYCSSDAQDNLFAQDVCAECGVCTASSGRRALEEEAEAKATKAFEDAVLKRNRRKLRHGCANSRSGCRVLPPPRR